MATTIQIIKDTQNMLKKLRESYHAESYDEVIQAMARRGVPKGESLYGVLGKKSIKHVLKGLRDEHDRY